MAAQCLGCDRHVDFPRTMGEDINYPPPITLPLCDDCLETAVLYKREIQAAVRTVLRG